MLERMVGTDRQRIARIAGAFYLVVFVTGAYAAIVRGPAGAVSGLIAGIFYIVVTLLFYDLFKPVNRRLSLVAALFSFAGIIAGPAGVRALNPLVFFGCYCLLIGYLIIRSDFLPSLLGWFMVFAGIGWLTFMSASLANALYPWNFGPGVLGEGLLTIWLLTKGAERGRGAGRVGAAAS